MGQAVAVRRYDFPEGEYPLTVRAYHSGTGGLVWEARVELPAEGGQVLHVPPLAKLHGAPVCIRLETAGGNSWWAHAGESCCHERG